MDTDYLISHRHTQTDTDYYLFDRFDRTNAVIAARKPLILLEKIDR